MQKQTIILTLNHTIICLLNHAIELEEALDLVQDESPQWVAISDELNEVRREIGWRIEYEYKQLPF